MAHNAKKTEHNGAKHGRGAYYGGKEEAKDESKTARRRNDQAEVNDFISANDAMEYFLAEHESEFESTGEN